MGLTGIDELVFDFFEGLTFHYHFFDFFEYMQVLCTFGIKMLIFSEYMQVWGLEVHQTCIYSKNQTFDSEMSPNLHILKKIKRIKNFRLYVGLTGIDELVFDFFDFFEYMQVWRLFTIIFFDFCEYMQVLYTFGIKMLIFFEYMQVLCAAAGQNHAFFASHAGFGEVQVTKPAEGMPF